MGIVSPVYFHPDTGRLIGSHVYMILCRDESRIAIKVGMSSDPMRRLVDIAACCPFKPEVLAVASVASRQIAFALESALHNALERWRMHGEWFRFLEMDKPEFNSSTNAVLAEFGTASSPLKWTKTNAQEVIREHRRQKAAAHRKFQRYGRSYHDAVKSGLLST